MSAERGSALMLLPAAVLALLVLGSVALDSVVVFTAQRQLADAAAAAANDAAVRGLDPAAFHACGAVRLDRDAVHRSVARSLATRLTDLTDPTVDVRVGQLDGRPSVTVRLAGRAPHILAPAVGGPATTPVHAQATAAAVTTGDPGDDC